jgi:hypothetical protein
MSDFKYMPLPADFSLLEKLPDRGMVGGLRWRGRRVKDVRDELLDEAKSSLDGQDLVDFQSVLTSSFIQARFRSMKLAGLVETYSASGVGGRHRDDKAGGSSVIWARTPAGAEFLNRKEEVLG